MKPPPRSRKKPSRITCPAAVPKSPGKVQWKRNEQMELLKALRILIENNGGEEDIDFVFLNKKVPTRSTAEITSYVESLKEKVISSAKAQLKINSRKEKEGRKPIQVWTQMASVLAGAHEDAIASAFSQLLAVSSTEPCTLRNCVPPRGHRAPTPTAGGRRGTVRRAPLPTDKAHRPGTNTAHHFPVFKTPSPTLGPAQRMQGLSKVFHMPTAPPAAAPASETLSAPPAVQRLASQAAATSSDPTAEATTQNADRAGNLSCEPPAPPPPAPPAPPAPSSVGPPSRPPAGGAGGASASGNGSGTSAEFTVDFEKIYLYLSAAHKPENEHKLSPMESAVVLDLLMSLPDELALINCSKLRKHFLQMHECLSAPANSRAARDSLKHLRDQLSAAGIKPADQPHTESSESNNTRDQPEEEDAMVPCPPLNPFLVPIKLLKRR